MMMEKERGLNRFGRSLYSDNANCYVIAVVCGLLLGKYLRNHLENQVARLKYAELNYQG